MVSPPGKMLPENCVHPTSQHGDIRAVNISAGIRVAYHLYQGPMAVLAIVPYARIAAVWFARTKRLAPLIVAHALMDFIALWAG